MEARDSTPIEAPAEPRPPAPAEPTDTPSPPAITHRAISEWQGRELIDRNGDRIGRLEDVYYDVETEEPQFGTVKEGVIARHYTFVPLGGATIGPDSLQVTVSREQVKSAPNVDLGSSSPIDESSLYHHYELNYTPLATESGRRLTRR
jgi:sporulation protein YlmC with PRC-barrel domain